MKIKANDRVLLAGKTGSGKTYFAMRLLRSMARLVVIDPKANLNTWSLVKPEGWRWRNFERGGNGRFRVLPPIVDKPEEWYEDLFEKLYHIGDLTLYIDEAYAVAQSAKPGKWLTALYTRGRELGIGTWAATQRPTWIPLFLISEADWLVTFRLNLLQDRQRIAAIAGDQLIERIPHEHGFWIYKAGDEKPFYFDKAVLRSERGFDNGN